MRTAFSDKLVEWAQKEPRLIVLTGDHGYALFDPFRKAFPEKFINCGIAEQNMVGVAAGLARGGFLPIVYGLAAFVPIRVLEQIKLEVCHDKTKVLFMGDGAGCVYSHLGPSHQCFEDIAAVNPLSNIDIYSPADSTELSLCFDAMIANENAAYMRMGKSDLGDVHLGASPTTIKAPILVAASQGKEQSVPNIVVFATGAMVFDSKKLSEDIYLQTGKHVIVYSVPSPSSLDYTQLNSILKGTQAIVTLEEHSIHGGLGSIVTGLLKQKFPLPTLSIGAHKSFSETCGTYAHLRREHGLDYETVLGRLRAFVEGLCNAD